MRTVVDCVSSFIPLLSTEYEIVLGRKNYRGNYFSEVDYKYPLHMQRTGGKDKNEVNEKGLV